MEALLFLLAAVILLIVYFFPTLVAAIRRHNNTFAICILNLFLGWTFLGWVVSLVWACTSNVAKEELPEKEGSPEK